LCRFFGYLVEFGSAIFENWASDFFFDTYVTDVLDECDSSYTYDEVNHLIWFNRYDSDWVRTDIFRFGKNKTKDYCFEIDRFFDSLHSEQSLNWYVLRKFLTLQMFILLMFYCMLFVHFVRLSLFKFNYVIDSTLYMFNRFDYHYDENLSLISNFKQFVGKCQLHNPWAFVTSDPDMAYTALSLGKQVLYLTVENMLPYENCGCFNKSVGVDGIVVTRVADKSAHKFNLRDTVNNEFSIKAASRRSLLSFWMRSGDMTDLDSLKSGLINSDDLDYDDYYGYNIVAHKLRGTYTKDMPFVDVYLFKPIASVLVWRSFFSLFEGFLEHAQYIVYLYLRVYHYFRTTSVLIHSIDSFADSIFSSETKFLRSPVAVARISGMNVYMKYHMSPIMYSLDVDLFMNAWTKYSHSKDSSYGVITATLGRAVNETQATIVTSILMANVKKDMTDCLLPDLSFQPIYCGVDPSDAKPMNIGVISNPVYNNDGFPYGVPKAGISTEYDTFARRLINPMNNKPLNSKYVSYMADFVDYLTPEKLTPLETYEVCDQMNRPSQKRNRDNAMWVINKLPGFVKDLFLKREPVAQNKPARNICTVSANRLYTMGRFTMAASEFMSRRFKWWVWGVGSGATSRKFHETAKVKKQFIESDFSKFDASLPLLFTSLNELLMKRWFPEWFDEIKEGLDDVFYQLVRSSKGLKFNYGHGRFTGENNTTLFNTIDQCFVQYCSLRDMSLSHEEAINIIDQSLYGGDDGITPYVGQDLAATATALGMVADVRIVDNNTPCRFLGRVYPSPSESTDSYYDLASFVKCIHLVNKEDKLDPIIGLINIVTGLTVTDINTPLISSFIKSVRRSYPERLGGIPNNDKWWFKHYDLNDPFTLDQFNDDAIIFNFTAETLKIDVADLYALRDWFDEHDFVVGSVLPVLHNNAPMKFTGALELGGGVTIGSPTEPPVLPTVSKLEIQAVNDAVAMGVDLLETSLTSNVVKEHLEKADVPLTVATVLNDSVLSGSLPVSNVSCAICGLSYHSTENCPNKTKCKICDKFGHTAEKCTQALEEAQTVAELKNHTSNVANLSDKVRNKLTKDRPKRRYHKRKD